MYSKTVFTIIFTSQLGQPLIGAALFTFQSAEKIVVIIFLFVSFLGNIFVFDLCLKRIHEFFMLFEVSLDVFSSLTYAFSLI